MWGNKLGPQSTIIKQAIEHYLEQGINDKQRIYSLVVEFCHVPRPTVRRVARDLRNEYLEKLKILDKEILRPNFFAKLINQENLLIS